MHIHKREAAPGHEQDVLARRPPHHPATALCIEALHDLDTERAMAIASGSNGQTFWTRIQHGPIPWSRVMQWCEIQGLDADNTAMVWSVVHEYDMKRLAREASERQLNGGA